MNFTKLKPGLSSLPQGVSFKHPHVLIATWFGAGLIKPAPGTMGTLAAIPPGLLIMHYGGPVGLLLAALLLFYIGTLSAQWYGEKSGEKDDQRIVVDEVVGMWIASIAAGMNPVLWISAFLMFRFFDIIKFWPASYYDRRKSGGFDVMMDDVVSGIFTFLPVAASAFKFNY